MSLFKVGDFVTPNYIEGSELQDYAFGFVHSMMSMCGSKHEIVAVRKWPSESPYQFKKDEKYYYLYDGYDYTLKGCDKHFSSCMFLECQNEL